MRVQLQRRRRPLSLFYTRVICNILLSPTLYCSHPLVTSIPRSCLSYVILYAYMTYIMCVYVYALTPRSSRSLPGQGPRLARRRLSRPFRCIYKIVSYNNDGRPGNFACTAAARGKSIASGALLRQRRSPSAK